MRCRFALAVLPLAGLALAGTAAAQEYCVQCNGPAATYACTVKDSDRLGKFRGSDRVLQYVCITELARIGGHESCRARRDGGACPGEARVIDFKQPTPGELAGLPQAPEPASTAPGTPSVDPQQGPPQTLEELARRTVTSSKEQIDAAGQKVSKTAKSAGEGIESTGKAVGGAFKKTWDCLASLFKSC